MFMLSLIFFEHSFIKNIMNLLLCCFINYVYSINVKFDLFVLVATIAANVLEYFIGAHLYKTVHKMELNINDNTKY